MAGNQWKLPLFLVLVATSIMMMVICGFLEKSSMPCDNCVVPIKGTATLKHPQVIPSLPFPNRSYIIETSITKKTSYIEGTHTEWNISMGAIGSRGRTDPTKSIYMLLGNAKETRRGQIIEFQIIAKDKYGLQRPFGGDLWSITMYNTKEKFGTMGKVIDHDDGTYSVYLYAGAAGVMNLKFTLVLQREAIQWLKSVVLSTEKRAAWIGTFTHGNVTEKKDCFIQREGTWEDKCQFPHIALGKTMFLCDPPASLPCGTLSLITVSRKPKGKATETPTSLFKKPNALQNINGPNSLEIKDIMTRSSDYEMHAVPKCRANISDALLDGYWLKDRWVSMVCQNRQWKDTGEVQQCLRNKEVYFLGDSTTRQWFQIFIETIGYPIKVNASNWRKQVDSIPGSYKVTAEDDYSWDLHDIKNNITAVYHHHALSRHSAIPIHRFPYFSDVVNQLRAPQCNYVILISLWAHFDTWTKDSFVDRLVILKENIDRLLQRCPRTKIVIKGPHERNSIGNHWLLYDMINTLKYVFDGSVFFFDIWDMNFAYAYANKKRIDIHMPMDLIREEVYFFLNYVCLN